MKKNDFLNILGFLALPFLAVALVIIIPIGIVFSFVVYKIKEKKAQKLDKEIKEKWDAEG
jgi:mannose/fructose/N-acetylgalactosamine-specific phosphotransferase system component IIC